MKLLLVCAAGLIIASHASRAADWFEVDRAGLVLRVKAAIDDSHPFRRANVPECLDEARMARSCQIAVSDHLRLAIVEGPAGPQPADVRSFFSGAHAAVHSAKASFDGVGQEEHQNFTSLCVGLLEAVGGLSHREALQAYVELRETAYSLASEGGTAQKLLRTERARLVVEASRGERLACEGVAN